MRSRLAAWHERRPEVAIPVYCVAAGFVATVAGAAASLLVQDVTAKIAVWMAVSAVLAVVAGCVYPVG